MNKLKASILVLGLVGAVASAPVLAAGEAGSSNPRQDVQALQARQAKADALFNQNNDALIDQDPSLGASWFNRIKISGVLNVDAGWSQRRDMVLPSAVPLTGTGQSMNVPTSFSNKGNQSYFDLSNSEIDIDAQVNSWVRAHVSFAGRDDDELTNELESDPNFTGRKETAAFIDEAYATFGDLTKTPLMATIGRQYVPFGEYQRHQITPTVVADLAETQATAAKAGFVSHGFNGSIYAFNGMSQRDNRVVGSGTANANHHDTIDNGGLDLGYTWGDQNMGFNVGAGYLRNMADVDLVSDIIALNFGGTNGYYKRVGAASGHIKGHYGPFGAELDFVTALRHFDASDVYWRTGSAQKGAIPWGGNVQATYHFKTMQHDSSAVLSYQQTGEAVALGLPENRITAGYQVNLLKNTDLKLQYMYEKNYSESEGAPVGLSENNNEVDARIAVRF